MPPNLARVTRTVRAPNSAARSAASTPAGPAPTTTTSIMLLRVAAIASLRVQGVIGPATALVSRFAARGPQNVPFPVEDDVDLAGEPLAVSLVVERGTHRESEAPEDSGREPGRAIVDLEIELVLVRCSHMCLGIGGVCPPREVEVADQPKQPQRREVVGRPDEPSFLVRTGKVLRGWRVDQGQKARIGPPRVLDRVARTGNRERPGERQRPVDQLNARPADLSGPVPDSRSCREGGTHGALVGEFRAEAEGPLVGKRVPGIHLRIHGIEGIDAILIADIDVKSRPRSQLDSERSDPPVAALCTGLLSHADESVRVPRLDLPEVSSEVLDDIHLASDGYSFEGVRGHPNIRWVDVALVDLLAVGLQDRIIVVSERSPRLTRHVVALLPRREKQSAVLIRRRI